MRYWAVLEPSCPGTQVGVMMRIAQVVGVNRSASFKLIQ